MEKQSEMKLMRKLARRKLDLDPRSPNFARDFAIAAKAFTRKATRSPEAALAVLVSEGIMTPSGKLTKEYGGQD
jgi:hypothetical protein